MCAVYVCVYVVYVCVVCDVWCMNLYGVLCVYGMLCIYGMLSMFMCLCVGDRGQS